MLKKIITFFTLILLILGFYQGVFALSNTEKWVILEKFKNKQEDLIFKNNIDINSLDALDLFKSNNKINIYENVLKSVWDEREKIEKDNLEIAKKIDDLQFQLKNLDKDIDSLNKETKKINSEIVKTSVEIKNKKNKIDDLKAEIEKNSEVLRKYISYVYKKWNLFLDKGKLDNLKAILLSWENLDSVINDIYFKELLSVAWRQLIQKHRKIIFNLYVETKKLETDSTNLKKLRKNFILKKKILSDKKDFKEKILSISKWKDKLYKKYIQEKIKVEKDLKLKAFSERIKFYNTSKKVLAKYGCIFVDVTKNTPEVRTLSKQCYDLNKIISLEARLEENRVKNESKKTFNIFAWPVSPYNWISAYYHDVWYKKEFHSEHEWVDIIADQWTNIVAPADWYVISIKKPTDSSYAYIAIKHSNWYVTVYWHISESLVEKYDYISAWDIFAKTGGTFWTPWAWYVSTGPHLHFEILRDKIHVDPLKYMDLSYLNFKTLPEAYRLDFFIDYKQRTGSEYEKKEDFTWKVFSLDWNNEIERQKSLLQKYARSDFANWNMWVEESLRWNIDPTFMMCVWLAETWLWRNLKTSYNVWNVWNVDSGGTWTMNNPRSWVWWMWHTLNNKYLWNYTKISQLSWYGKETPNSPIYASDPIHWHRNVTKCMSTIKWQYIPDDYNFRTY